MAKVRTPRGAWVDAALQALAAGGPDAVRVEALAVSLGVSKGGFYWHFKDRQALLEEMLDSLGEGRDRGRHRARRRASRPTREPRCSSSSNWPGRPILPWSWRSGTGRAATVTSPSGCAGSTTGAWGGCARCSAQFCADENDVEARSMLAYSLLIGSYFIAAQHGGKTRSQVLQLAVDRLLSESWD